MSQCASACQASGVPKQIIGPSSESRREGDARGPSSGRHDPLGHYPNEPQFFLCHKWLTSLPHARCPHSSRGPRVLSDVALRSECRVSRCESGQLCTGFSGAVSHMAPLDSRTGELKGEMISSPYAQHARVTQGRDNLSNYVRRGEESQGLRSNTAVLK